MTPEIIDTPLGRFYATPTKPGHAELTPVGDPNAPIIVNTVAYRIRGEFRLDDSWAERVMPGWQRVDHQEPYAAHVGSYSICRVRAGGKTGACGYGAITDKARHKIGRALGPALQAFLERPEVRADAHDNQRAAWAKRWQDRADSYRDTVKRLTEKIAECERGAAAIRAGGEFRDPPYHLTV